MPSATLDELKELLVKNCMLQVEPDTIKEDTLLFGPDSLGLDSIDALQLSVAVEKTFGVPMKDPEIARRVLRNLGTLRNWLNAQG